MRAAKALSVGRGAGKLRAAGGAELALKGRALTQIWKAFKELNPKNLAAEAARPVRMGVVGSIELLQQTATYMLTSDTAAFDKAGDTLILIPTPLDSAAFGLLPRCDVVLVSAEAVQSLPGVATERLFTFSSADDLPRVIDDILARQEVAYAHIPLARALPAFRAKAAIQTIQSVSIENAVFVTSTSLGNIIPNPLQPLASVAESVGDTVVLTANQIRMLFRLAAIFDRELGLKQQSPEVLSIVGAAFGWRSIARELVSKVPFGGGVVPKAAIAFAGTWAIGDGIAFYYKTGRRLTKAELRQRFDLAMEKGKASAELIVGKLRKTYSGGKDKPGEEPMKLLE